MKILRSLFVLILILLCCKGTIYTQPWTSIESSGLNANPAVSVYNVKLESLNGNIYAVWLESGLVRVKRYDGGTTWTSVDGGGKSWSSATCNDMASTVYNNALYIAWRESDTEVGGIYRIHVIRYDGTSWAFVQSYTPGVLNDGRHYISMWSTGYAYSPSLGVHNGKLYASWIDQTSGSFNNQVRVSEFDGTYWKSVDGNNPDAGLNKNYSALFEQDYPMITMASYGSNLYVAWRELNPAKTLFQLRVKRYDGGSSWTFVDGDDPNNGLNYAPSNPYFGIEHQPRLVNYNGFLYAFFSEPTYNDPSNGYTFQLRWKKYNGTSWINDDGVSHGAAGISGWNRNIAFQTNDPAAITDGNKIYTSWGEYTEVTAGNYWQQIHVISFDGTTKTFIDGNLNTGINYNTANEAHFSNLLIHNGDLYAAWQENNGTSDKFRVKKYALPPVVQSVSVPAIGTYVSGQPLNFTVNFSKTVNVSGGTPYLQLTLNTGGTVNANYVSGSGTNALVFRYTVAAGNNDNDGISVGTNIILPGGCTLRSSDTSPLDAGLTLSNAGSTTAVMVDAVSPFVNSINRQNPVTASTNAASVIFRVSFSENVSNVDVSDFSLTTTETAAGTVASVSASTGTTIDVTVNITSGYGTLRLDLKSSGTGIIDNAGNAISGGFTTGQTYTTPDAAITFADGSSFTQNFAPGSPNQVIGRFQLTSDLNGAFLTSVSIKLNGTRSGLTNLTLWSSTDGTFDSGTDTQLGTIVESDPGDGNSVSFSGLSNAISTSGIFYFITTDAGSDALGNIQGVIVQNSSITINRGTISGIITNALLSNNTAPLPVELTSFNVSAVNNSINLKWTTATEVNNYGFEVERNTPLPLLRGDNAANPFLRGDERGVWEKIGFVPGAGNSNSTKEYGFFDENPIQGNAEYRLKQIDLDGKFKYYAYTAKINFLTAVKENRIPKEFGLLQNYPNPFNPATTIEYSIPENPLLRGVGGVLVSLKVYDILGNEVATLVNENKQPGYYQVSFNANNLSTGVYIYRLTTCNFTLTKKLMLMK